MSTLPQSLPLPMIPAPDPVDAELEPLLSHPLASAWELPESEARTSAAGLLRSRLLARVAGSQASAAPMTTSRRRRQTLAAPVRASFSILSVAVRAIELSARRRRRGKVQISENHRFSNLSSLSVSLSFRACYRVSVQARYSSSSQHWFRGFQLT